MDFDTYRLATGSGFSFTAGTSTASYTLPITQATVNAAAGISSNPRYLRVLAEGNAYINFGYSPAVTVGTLNGVLVNPNQAEILNVAGYTYVACIAKSATVVNFTPIEL